MSVAHSYVEKILRSKTQLHAIYIKNEHETHMQKMLMNLSTKSFQALELDNMGTTY